MKKITTLICLLSVLLTFGQTLLSKKDYETNIYNRGNTGEKVHAKNKNGKKLHPGSYMYEIKEGTQPLSFWFSIVSTGEIDGTVKVIIGVQKEGQLLAEIKVKEGLVLGVKEFHQRKKYLEKETYTRGDTIITKSYKETKTVYYELKTIKGENIYEYSCSDYYENPEMGDCSKIDFIKGIEEKYLKGKLITVIKTKNLPGSIKEVIKNFDFRNKIKKRITYTNGVVKTFYRNGNYKIEKPIRGGVYEELYNSKEKLIDSGKVYDIMG